jgi:dihydroorotate dehydrogenase (fumarate)
MIDMRVNYLGLELAHPLIVGASPQADSLDGVRRAEDGGAAAIVFRSLFEEQLDTEAMATFSAMEMHAEMNAEATHFMPEPSDFKIGPEQYLEGIRRAKAAVRIPVIGSLNGTSLGGWLSYGRAIEEVGADALELNIFDVPVNERVSGAEIEEETVEMVREPMHWSSSTASSSLTSTSRISKSSPRCGSRTRARSCCGCVGWQSCPAC